MQMMTHREYSKDAIERTKDGALEWLMHNTDGYPRSWEQEDICDEKRGYLMYDDFEAPPIAGYEALERDGVVIRVQTVVRSGQERIHFKGRLILEQAGSNPALSTNLGERDA